MVPLEAEAALERGCYTKPFTNESNMQRDSLLGISEDRKLLELKMYHRTGRHRKTTLLPIYSLPLGNA